MCTPQASATVQPHIRRACGVRRCLCAQTGFLDNNAYIRELTLKSMLSLGPRMSQKTLNNSVLKYLSKLQVCGACPCKPCAHALSARHRCPFPRTCAGPDGVLRMGCLPPFSRACKGPDGVLHTGCLACASGGRCSATRCRNLACAPQAWEGCVASRGRKLCRLCNG